MEHRTGLDVLLWTLGAGGLGAAGYFIYRAVRFPADEGAPPPTEMTVDLPENSMPTVEAWLRGKQISITLAAIAPGHFLDARVQPHYIEMAQAAKSAGITLWVSSAFRTMAQQQILYTRYLNGGPLAAKPGWSNHQAGRAVDLATANGTNEAFRWLTANAKRFGFERTVKSEPWHWEFTGPLGVMVS